MAKFCARCGAKIGLLTRRIPAGDGLVCGKCFTPEELKKFEALVHPPPWTCSQCGMPNPLTELVCQSCGRGVKPSQKK